MSAVHALGHVDYLRPGFHTAKHIWPLGYRATRTITIPGSGKPGRQLAVRCSILEAPDGSGPLFRWALCPPCGVQILATTDPCVAAGCC